MRTNYVLIDYENVQPDIWHIADDFEVDVTVFVGPRQRVNPKTSEVIHRMDTRGEVIKVCNAGPNALDFHLAFHLGQLVMSDATSTFEIVSNDKGYDSLINQLAAKGVQIQRTPGLHRPEGYAVEAFIFTPFHLRRAATDMPAEPPAAIPSEPPREPSSLRKAIKALERSLRALKAQKPRTYQTQRQIKRTSGRIARLKLALATATASPNEEVAPSGRKVLRLPARR